METTETTSAPKAPKFITLTKRSNVKKYALAVAAAKRPTNRFQRVGASFCIAREASLEAAIRRLADTTHLAGTTPPPPGFTGFTTGFAKARAAEKLEELARLIIHGAVMSHPSTGRTLRD